MINQRDEYGLQHGLWFHYHPGGGIAYKLMYIHGKHHGLYLSYYRGGGLKFKGFFKNKRDIGLCYAKKYDY